MIIFIIVFLVEKIPGVISVLHITQIHHAMIARRKFEFDVSSMVFIEFIIDE